MRDRRAVTLLELLIVFGIIAILLALFLPAIQFVRESSRRLTCASRLRQVGLALHAYNSTYSVFPSDAQFLVRILPFLEYNATYQLYNSSHAIIERENSTLSKSFVGIYTCPTDPYAKKYPHPREQYTSINGNYGNGVPWHGWNGVFVDDGFTTAAQVSDGMEHTAAASEILVGNGKRDPLRTVFSSPKPMTSPNDLEPFARLCANFQLASAGLYDDWTRGMEWVSGGGGVTWYNHILTPNQPSCNNGDWPQGGIHTAASLHPGGVNLLFLDNSVTFIGEDIDVAVWRAFGSRAGNDNL